MGASSGGAPSGRPALQPHLIDAHLLPGADASGLRPDVRAIRAARPLLDKLDRVERRRIAAVVVSGGDAQAAPALCARITGALALGACLTLSSVEGIFDGLHLAGALLKGWPDKRVLLVSTEMDAAAFLLGGEGGVSCRPLPPTLANAANADAYAACGSALASSLARGGVLVREVGRVVGPGLARVEAASVARHAGLSHALAASTEASRAAAASAEALLADATIAPPLRSTLLWRRTPDDVLEGCVLSAAQAVDSIARKPIESNA